MVVPHNLTMGNMHHKMLQYTAHCVLLSNMFKTYFLRMHDPPIGDFGK